MMQGGSSEALKSAVWKSDGNPSLTGYKEQWREERIWSIFETLFLKIDNQFSKIHKVLPLNDGFSKSRLFGHIMALAKIRSKQHRSK